ncbi:restriction endonuclease subunit S [Coprococcus catus]|uniref:restriction endonuclease subunit S n=1 Tax=Coprococcus catus TaxID=116085 RepID=UPI001C0204A6|nr:restriction endonuclease subunit S [Coprococcus catus]MBT9774004.1 restriction endonuclease subunit S [Coprococcus catus]
MAVPKLRFKADDGSDYPEWNDFTKLEDISAFITKGATPTTYGFDWQPNGVYFFRNDCIKNNVFVYGDYSFIAEEANKFLQRSEVTGGDIVIAITGDIGKVGLIPSEVKKANINQHLARVRIVKDAFPYFVYMYLCSDKVQRTYKKIKTGLSMPQLSLAQIRDTNIPVVSLPEQQKIAEFLSTIDTVIAKQRETVFAWEERKKGVMQKLFSQEVRFKADDGSDFPEWEEKKIDDLFYKVNERNNGQFGKDKWISVAKMYYQDEDKVTSNNIDTRTYVMRVGDMSFEGHPNKEFKYGRFVVNDIGDGIISELFPIYRHKENYILKYWKYAIQVDSIMQKIYRKSITSSGASSNKLDDDDFKRQSILVPCLAEQQKIADCLSSLDEVIETQKATLAAWEELKKGLLQQMFV